MSDPHAPGCFVAVSHWPPERTKRLTYNMVGDVLRGLWEFLYGGERFVCADFYVLEDGVGEVGFGRLLGGSPGLGVGVE